MKNLWTRWGVASLIIGLTTGVLLQQFPQKNLNADLLTATNSALPFMCSSVSTASSSNPGGNSPGNLNYGISMWYGVGSVTPYSDLGPTGNELATLSDSNVFEQRYVGTTPAVLAVGASDAIGEQTLTVTCDTGSINVYTPALSSISGNMRLYVAKDGSTYHSRANHNYSTFPSAPDLTPTQALRPEHLAKAAPTYQPDCYNTATITYSDWSCDGLTTRKRTKFSSGYGYVAGTNTCSNSQLDTGFETEDCATGLTCNAGQCGIPTYTVDDDFNSSMANFNVSNFSSLQAAIDAAPAGATVRINGGTYTGNFTSNKNLTIEGAAANQVILDGNGSGTVFTITSANGFSLSGVTVRNGGKGDSTPGNVGIHVNPSAATTSLYTIKDNLVYNNRNGIMLWNGLNASATIQNNMIFRNTDTAFSNDGFGTTSLINNTISDNGSNGYYDWVGKGPHTIKNNIIVNNGKHGFLTHRDSTPRTVHYNNIWGNTLGNYMVGYSGPYTALTVTPGTGEMTVDPQFTNRTNANYSLASTSPLIGKGENGVNMGSNLSIGTTNLPPLSVTSPSSSVPVPGNTIGLIGHWKFDGNGNNEIAGSPAAVIVGNAAFRTEGGKYGGYGAIVAKADWFKIPYSSIYDLPNAFTIEFWFRQRSTQSHFQDLVYKGNGPNNYNFRVFRQLWNQYNFGPIIAGFTSAKTGYWTQTSNTNEMAHNVWHHVVYTKSPAETVYYLDGVLVGGGGTYADQAEPAKTPAVDIIIGDSAVDTDIDNLRIYNRGMTKDEVRINGGFPPDTTSTTTSSTSACVGGNGRIPGLPTCLMPENLTGTVWNEVDNATGRVLNTAICSLAVCGRNGEWRSARNMNNTYYPNGYPPNSTFIQTPFNVGYERGQYYTNGVWENGDGGIVQPGSTQIIYPSSTPVNTGTYATGSGTYASTTPTSTTVPSTSSQNINSTTSVYTGTTPANTSVFYGTGTYVPGPQQPQPMPISGTGTWAQYPTEGMPVMQPSFTPLPQDAPTALTRSLSAAEETLVSFESFVATVDPSKVRAQTLDQAYNLIDEASYYVQQIRRAVSEGNLAHANRRLGLLQQVMADIKRTWGLLGRGQKLEVPNENFFSSENIVKEELATYGMQDIADQIAKIIMEKINFSEIVSQVVKQSSETLNRLLAYSGKHEETVSKTMDVLVTVDEKFHEDYLEKKVEVLEAVDRFDEKLAAFEAEKSLKSELVTRIDELKEKIISYNFIGSTGEKMKAELEKFIEQFNDPDLSEEKIAEEIAELNTEAEAAMAKAREEKFEQGAIPFKDTDDHEWFTQYVVPIQKEGIISGYKDAQGNSLGQFGPANNVTVAEILKIALESAELGEGEVTARLGTFEGHWAIGYVSKGKELGLTLLKEIETADQLNRPATRAEVVRVLLEVFNASVDFEQDTRFEDAQGHKDEAYIEAARELEIIAGYDDGTFKPDASVNRAETSKIVNLVMTSL